MLKSLSVRNYALIDQLEVDLSPGMTAITGETGSGKSILLGALGLALGDRADLKSLLRNDRKCVVELCARLPESQRSFFEEHDLDFESDCLIRREITPSGKSRSFINDTPVPLTVTRSLAAQVVDIHSQHGSSLIASPAFQLSLLDSFAGSREELAEYSASFHGWKEAKTAFESLRERSEQWQRDRDYLEFQLRELEAIDLDELNPDELESRVEQMERSEEIQEALDKAVGLIQSDQGAEDQLSRAEAAISRIATVSPEFEILHQRISACLIELRDLAGEMETQGENIERDPRALAQAQSDLNVFHSLSQKHLVADIEELRVKRDEIRETLRKSERVETDLHQLEAEAESKRNAVIKSAERLSKKRSSTIKEMLKDLRTYLDDLGLKEAAFDLVLTATQEPQPDGMDQVDLRFCANPGGSFLPVGKVASGGEISRVMLALKASLARKKQLPCVIFDEIDTGISGEMARKVGLVLKALSRHAQLITITHQPSIAGLADQHFKVYKETAGANTRTLLRPLDKEGRVQEIAEMIAGQDITDASRTSARELLSNH